MVETAKAIAKRAVLVREAFRAAREEFIPRGKTRALALDDDLESFRDRAEAAVGEFIHQRLHFIRLQHFEDVLRRDGDEQLRAFLDLRGRGGSTGGAGALRGFFKQACAFTRLDGHVRVLRADTHGEGFFHER